MDHAGLPCLGMGQVGKDWMERADPMRGEVETEEQQQTVVASVGPRLGAASERQKQVAVERGPERAHLAWGTWWVQHWGHPTCLQQEHSLWLVHATEDFLNWLQTKHQVKIKLNFKTNTKESIGIIEAIHHSNITLQ